MKFSLPQLEKNFPRLLLEQPIWALHRAAQGDKKPLMPNGQNAKSNDQSTWSTFAVVREAFTNGGFDGVGIMVTEGTLIGIDLDHVLDKETRQFLPNCEWAEQLIKDLGTYAEKSWTDGVHALSLANGTIAAVVDRPMLAGKLSVYPRGRFLVTTGEALSGPELKTYDPTPVNKLSDTRIRKGPWTRESVETMLELCGIAAKPIPYGGSLKWVFTCFKVPEHKDAVIFLTNGWVSYKCFHYGASHPGELTFNDFCEYFKKQLRDFVFPASRFASTEMGNAERFTSEHGEHIRYCHDARRWYVWNGTRFAPDITAEIRRLALRTVRNMEKEAAEIEDREERASAFKWAINCENRSRIDNMIVLAQDQRAIATTTEEFDGDPLLFNVKNGVLNLESGQFEEHSPARMLSKVSPVDYDPKADCPTWVKFINEIFEGDQELISFVQRACGYTMTGLTIEEVIFLLLGEGQNGKTKFLETLVYIWGDYAQVANTETFLQAKFNGNNPRPDIAALKGARLVKASETGEGRRLSEALIKELTGGDSVTARFLYQEHFTFIPVLKLWLATNAPPVVRGQEQAMWRRLLKIPFNYTVPEEKRDRNLGTKLRAEASGILNWMLTGYAEYKRHGLGIPDAVKKATAEYRESQDVVLQWLEDGHRDPEAQTPAPVAHRDFQDWCRVNRLPGLDKQRFGLRLKKLGIDTSGRTKHGKVYAGIRVTSLQEEPIAY